MRYLALAMAGASLACAGVPSAGPVPVAMPTPGETAGGEVIFVPTGSIGTGATFDGRRVVGPTVNMAATPEGWGGNLRGRNVVLSVSEGRLSGSAFEVAVEREGDVLRLGGLVGNRRVSMRLSPRSLQGAIDGGVCSFDLSLTSPGWYQGTVACPPPRGRALPRVASASLRLSGDAARVDRPVLPQLALALLAVLPP